MCNNVQYIIGLMSGTSLDGLDIAFCRFKSFEGSWTYEILQAETVPYSREWQIRLSSMDGRLAADLAQTDCDLGHLMGKMTRTFMEKHRITADFIASHGQTVFHQPHLRWTTQIGKGAAIAAETGLPVVCDFRSTDVALGGQGAPVVPIGDQLLFSDYQYCLNLGGFANISFHRDGKRVAYDICPANMVLNELANQTGKAYDDKGDLARSGSLLPDLLESLNQLPFYHQPPPKSLGKEWVDQHIYPILDLPTRNPKPETRNLLHTWCEHIAIQVGNNTGTDRVNKLLITGGGALNQYLMERIRHYVTAEVVIPDLQTIQFKEALIFAFLGLLRWRNEVNVLSTVTGAKRDSIGGAIYL
ncbi:MAG: anhydro-N-acetylmuramic acid kinase [Bacteroidales bacterium]|nr:anhydro-N-acetylmuramic acid kinase [Bacteroidales bacterium]